jgi:hypothetical protein
MWGQLRNMFAFADTWLWCDVVTHSVVFPEPSSPSDEWLGWAEPAANLYLESTLPEAVVARE